MRRNLPFAVFALSFLPLGGCADESTTVTQSPEMKKADAGGQDGMRELMQSKAKATAKPAAKRGA